MREQWSAGDRIGDRFRLERRIGVGSFGSVWLGIDETNRALVAVKLLHPELPALQRASERLAREASLLLTLDHPNIARALAYVEPDFALVLEYVEGRTLREIMVERDSADRSFSLEEISRMVAELLAALELAHSQGVVHRDLKPSNLIIRPDGRLKVLDFGVAKLLATEGDATTIGRVLGTWLYMSPEQARGEPLDHRADLFAVGVLLFELLTLRRPFALDAAGKPLSFSLDPREGVGNSRYEILERLVVGSRPKIRDFREDLPAALEVLIFAALAPDAQLRPASAQAMAQALVEAMPDLTTRASEFPSWSEAVTTAGVPNPAKAGDTVIVLSEPGPTKVETFRVGPSSRPGQEPLRASLGSGVQSVRAGASGPIELVPTRAPSSLEGSTEGDGPVATVTRWLSPRTTMTPRPEARRVGSGLMIAASLGVLLAVIFILARPDPEPERPPPPAAIVVEAPPPIPIGLTPRDDIEAPQAPLESRLEPKAPEERQDPVEPRGPRKARTPDPRPRPVKAEADALAALWASVKDDPENVERFTRFAEALKAGSVRLDEPDKGSVTRCVTASELSGRISDLERCYAKLVAAKAR